MDTSLAHYTWQHLEGKWEKIDKERAEQSDDLPIDTRDPCMVSEYTEDIFSNLRAEEKSTLINPDFLMNQPTIFWYSRSIAIEYIVRVHSKFNMVEETLYLAKQILDSFLSIQIVDVNHLQLVALTSLFIAGKYEETGTHISIQRYSQLDESFCTSNEILDTERVVLSTLGFGLNYPGPMNFLRRIYVSESYNVEYHALSKYLTEITIIDIAFLGVPPSMVAASASYLARYMLGRVVWVNTTSNSTYYLDKGN